MVRIAGNDRRIIILRQKYTSKQSFNIFEIKMHFIVSNNRCQSGDRVFMTCMWAKVVITSSGARCHLQCLESAIKHLLIGHLTEDLSPSYCLKTFTWHLDKIKKVPTTKLLGQTSEDWQKVQRKLSTLWECSISSSPSSKCIQKIELWVGRNFRNILTNLFPLLTHVSIRIIYHKHLALQI